MADYNMESLVYEINFESARIAKDAALKYSNLTPNKPRFVADLLDQQIELQVCHLMLTTLDTEHTFDDLVVAYSEQINALIDGGVDILLIETIFDALNAKAAFCCGSILDKKIFILL